MNNEETPVDKRIEETKSGVTITCTSKRGSGTDDRDKVKAVAHYEDIAHAHANASDLVDTVRGHISKLRRLDDKGRETRS